MNGEGTDHWAEQVSLALIDSEGWRIACLDEVSALTLFAVASEDPADWEEMIAYWSRYRTPMVAEFADGLALQSTSEAMARAQLADTDRWLVIDLIRKRIVCGEGFVPVGRDQVFAMEIDEQGDQHFPLSIHLPPWWELHEQTTLNTIDQPREKPIRRPRPDRKVLFGQQMIDDLARRILDLSQSQRWRESGAAKDPGKRNPFTIEVHRDWLMTPRDDLGGLMPREMLHGGTSWIDHLVWAQRLRFEDGAQLIAAPVEVVDFDETPMGHEEICIYFDLCREIIAAGWSWCSDRHEDAVLELSALQEFLTDVKTGWLNEPFEGGSPPRFILECSRRRVPRGSDVAIVGMDERQAEQHVADCDCPICQMMTDGLFGVGFTSIDGHHLELDHEFAFSLCETREQWERQQREHEEFPAALDCSPAEPDNRDPDSLEFSTAWSGQLADEPIPGDASGHLRLAFLLAEIGSILESLGAPGDEIKQLNHHFRQFREADEDSRESLGAQLNEGLEDIASKYPALVSRAADLQSRIDESIRQMHDINDEFPH